MKIEHHHYHVFCKTQKDKILIGGVFFSLLEKKIKIDGVKIGAEIYTNSHTFVVPIVVSLCSLDE